MFINVCREGAFVSRSGLPHPPAAFLYEGETPEAEARGESLEDGVEVEGQSASVSSSNCLDIPSVFANSLPGL